MRARRHAREWTSSREVAASFKRKAPERSGALSCRCCVFAILKPPAQLGSIQLLREVMVGHVERRAKAEVHFVADDDPQAGADADVRLAARFLEGAQHGIGERTVLER